MATSEPSRRSLTIKLSIIIVRFIVTLKFTINLIEVKLYGYVGAFTIVIDNKTKKKNILIINFKHLLYIQNKHAYQLRYD